MQSCSRVLASAVVLVGAVAALALTGCQSGASARPDAGLSLPPDTLAAPSAAEREAALARLRTMQRTVFDSAFVRMRRFRFARHQHTEHLTATGAVAASKTRTVRYTPKTDAPVVEQADSTGMFPQPTLSTFGPESTLAEGPTNIATDAFPEDAAFLSPRTQDAFRYWLRPDTLDGVPVDAVIVRPAPTPDGAERSVRYARLALLPNTGQLVDAYMVRAATVLLFQEQSRLRIQLRRAPAPDGVAGASGPWVPHLARVHTRVDLPFRDPRVFRTASTYTNYAR